MDVITEKLMEHGTMLAKHESDIKTLYQFHKDIKTLADNTHQIALSVRELTGKVQYVDKRLECIEKLDRQKRFEVWKAIVPAILSAVVAYFVAQMI